MREDAKYTFFLGIHLLQLFDGHLLDKDSRGFRADKLVLRVQNQLYRLSFVRNDLHVTEFFEPIFAELHADP
jgi:hypothetical protein